MGADHFVGPNRPRPLAKRNDSTRRECGWGAVTRPQPAEPSNISSASLPVQRKSVETVSREKRPTHVDRLSDDQEIRVVEVEVRGKPCEQDFGGIAVAIGIIEEVAVVRVVHDAVGAILSIAAHSEPGDGKGSAGPSGCGEDGVIKVDEVF